MLRAEVPSVRFKLPVAFLALPPHNLSFTLDVLQRNRPCYGLQCCSSLLCIESSHTSATRLPHRIVGVYPTHLHMA